MSELIKEGYIPVQVWLTKEGEPLLSYYYYWMVVTQGPSDRISLKDVRKSARETPKLAYVKSLSKLKKEFGSDYDFTVMKVRPLGRSEPLRSDQSYPPEELASEFLKLNKYYCPEGLALESVLWEPEAECSICGKRRSSSGIYTPPDQSCKICKGCLVESAYKLSESGLRWEPNPQSRSLDEMAQLLRKKYKVPVVKTGLVKRVYPEGYFKWKISNSIFF